MATFARVTAWFNDSRDRTRGKGWSERAYFPGVTDQTAAVERAAAWLDARSRLLAPGPLLVAASVGMEDTARDSLFVEVPPPRFQTDPTGVASLTPYYNPATLGDGAAGYAWTAVEVSHFALNGRQSSSVPLRGFAASYATTARGFVPSQAWLGAWRRFVYLLAGFPPDDFGPGGDYGFKCQVLDPSRYPRVPLAGGRFDGVQFFRARGHGLNPGNEVRIGLAHGAGVQANGLWRVLSVPDPDTFTTEQPAPGFTWYRGGYVRRIAYQIARLQKVDLGRVVHDAAGPEWHPLTWEYVSGRRPPIDPCGKVVTWGREPGPPGAFRFFRDADDETLVQWRLADCAALPLTMYHVFGSQVYMDHPSGPWLHVGEVERRRHGPREQRPSAYPGVCHLGTDAQWRSGCLTTDPLPPVPPCCLAAARDVSVIIIGTDSGWGTVVTLLVEQYDGTGQVPTVTTLDFDQASRLVVDSLGSGHAGVRWLGLRGYHAGDGFLGPQPDIEFLDGGGLAWTVTQDAVNKRIVVGAVASGGGGTGLTYGTATDESAYTLTTTSARTGWSVTLPAAGRYFLWAHARIDASATGSAGLVEFVLSLVNATTPANLVSPSNAVGCTHRFAPGDLATVVATVPVAGEIVTTAPGEVVELHAAYLLLSGVAPAVLELLGSSVALQYIRLDAPGGGSPGPPGPPGPPGSMTLGTTPVTGGTPGQFLTVGPGGTLAQSPGGGGGGSLGIGTTPVAGGSPGEVLTVGPDGTVGQSIGLLAGDPAGGDLGGTFPNPEVLDVDGGTWE